MSHIEVHEEARKVAILTPATDLCHTAFAYSLVHMVQCTLLAAPPNLAGISAQSFGCSIIPYSRNVLAQAALDRGVTHCLFIDSDMRFPADMLLRFLLLEPPIVGINAMSRTQPYRNTAFALDDPTREVDTTLESQGLERVAKTGTGVLWIATEVFRKLDEPWFVFEYVPEQKCFLGEDYYFCERAKEAGYEIHIDHGLSKDVQHIGTMEYNPVMKAFAEQREVA